MMAWAGTIKFKIAALAIATGVLSAIVTAQSMMGTIRTDIENLLLESGAEQSAKCGDTAVEQARTCSRSRCRPPDVRYRPRTGRIQRC